MLANGVDLAPLTVGVSPRSNEWTTSHSDNLSSTKRVEYRSIATL